MMIKAPVWMILALFVRLPLAVKTKELV